MSDIKFVGLHAHSLSMGDSIGYPEDHFKFVLENGGDGLAITDHGTAIAWGYLQQARNSFKKKGIPFKAIFGCLTPGQEIITRRGVKYIEDIEIGDEVLTHKGRFRKVLTTSEREYVGEVYDLHLGGNYSKTISITEEHPILIRDRDGKIDWVKAKDLNPGRPKKSKSTGLKRWNSYVAFPRLEEVSFDKKYLAESISGDYQIDISSNVCLKNQDPNKNVWKMDLNPDNDFYQFLGLYVAEGSLRFSKKKNRIDGTFCFSFNIDEVDYADFISQFARDRLGVNPYICARSEKSIIEVIFCHKPFADLILHLCGRLSNGKVLSEFIMNSDSEKTKFFLLGLSQGDGHKTSSGFDSIKLCNKDLIWQIKMLIAKLNYYNKVITIKETEKNEIAYSINYNPDKSFSRCFSDDLYVYKNLLKVEKRNYKGKVYNLEVEEDNSFVGDITYHNCELYYHPDLDEWAEAKRLLDEEPQEAEGLVIEVESDSKEKLYWADPIKRRHHLVVLVQNIEGYHNLCRIITESYRKGFYRYPRTDRKTLERYNKGLIISTACIAGQPAWSVLQNHERGDDAVFASLDKELKPLLDVFGKERANLEIQFNKLPEQKLVNKFLMEYSKKTGYPLLATADSHYARPEQWREREIYKMLAQQTKGFNVGIEDLPKSIDELKCELYPKNGEQMLEEYLAMYPETTDEMDQLVVDAIQRSHIIAHEQIEDVSPDTKMKLPRAFLKGADPSSKIEEICYDALLNIADGWDDERIVKYKDRLDLELGVIKKKDFALYFLALKEAMDKIKEKLLVGAGRGSGAGSLVCYLMGITLIDPIEHGLLFERFLSENRNEPPDIDTDVEDRDVALEILRGHFGENNVIAISNFNSLQLKSLIKDISKLYQIPFEEVNAVTSVMEDEARQPILDSIGGDQKLYVFDFDGAYEHSKSFRDFIDKYPKVAESVKVLFRQLKAIGRHAGGTIITENAEDNMPIIRIRGVDQTPWGEGLTAKHLEPFGFIKYDFLGIATLRTIKGCIERILEKQMIDPSPQNVNKFFLEYLHPDVIGQGDETVFQEIYHKGRFCGTFQLAERNVQDFCVNAKPTSVSDVSVLTSIYRPGPLCISGDSTILVGCSTQENKRRWLTYKSLEDLFDQFHKFDNKKRKQFPLYLLSFDEKDQKLTKNKILNVYKSGKKEVFSVKVRKNLTGSQQEMISSENKHWNLKSSIDHKFLTLTGWKNLGDIKRGEYILTQKKSLSYGDDPRKNIRKSENIKGKKNFSNICFRYYQYKCVFCDWKDGRLDVNHVEGNRHKNNDYENLSFLCPNHHRVYSEGNISNQELKIEREKLSLPDMEDFIYVQFLGIESCGEEETYDISVESPNNNFIAGGFVVHNSGQADKKYVHLVNNPDDVDFYHPIIEEVLGETKGLLCYQEQFMLLAHKLAGFSLVESDELRKLLVKPVTSLGEEMKKKRVDAGERFIDGCVENGLTRSRAEDLWNKEIMGFISYGFNKCLYEEVEVVVKDVGKVKIKNVNIGDKVLTKSGYEKVKDVIKSGRKKLVKIKTSSGKEVTCTLDHKLETEFGMKTLSEILENKWKILCAASS